MQSLVCHLHVRGLFTRGCVKKLFHFVQVKVLRCSCTLFLFFGIFTVERGSQIHFVNSASKRLIKSVEESKCAVAQQAPKAFWVGVWKCIRHPPTCLSVCMYSCSFTPRLSLSSVSHTQTSAWHIHTGISHFASRLSKTIKIMRKMCKLRHTRARAHACTRDVMLTKVTRHLSKSRLRSAPRVVTVESAYWS